MKIDSSPSDSARTGCGSSISSAFQLLFRKCALKVKKFKFSPLLVCSIVFGGYFWLTIAAITPQLPSSSKPLVFYSNELNANLKICLLRAVKKAKKSIFFQIYGLTDPDLIALLSQRAAEGVDVKVFYDKKASKSLPSHFPAFPMNISGLMHRKIFLFDDTISFFGTANCTPPSLTMHGNLMVGIHSREITQFLRKSAEDFGQFSLGETELNIYLLPDFEGKAIDALIGRLRCGKKTIRIAMFTLTHPLLVQELIAAKRRGVDVMVALDHYTALGASRRSMDKLSTEGISLFVSQGSQLLHHKWALIDEETFILGSANWTRAAFEKNQDCLMIFHHLDRSSRQILRKIWGAVANASRKE